jgi:hypothetical protein
MALPFNVLYVLPQLTSMGPQSCDSNSRPLSDDCYSYVSGFDYCSHQPLYWKHLRKYAANESVLKFVNSGYIQDINSAQQKYEDVTSLTVPTSTHSLDSYKGEGFKSHLTAAVHRTCSGVNINENHTYY